MLLKGAYCVWEHFVDHSGYFLLFFLIFVMLSCLFIAALLSSAGKGLTSWLSCVCFFFFFFFFFDTILYGVSGQLWYLIVLIPDRCFFCTFITQLYGVYKISQCK